MVRLKRKSPETRRDHIIAVASNSFGLSGFSATSMSSIADAVGGSKATLYKYFPSKDSIFEAVVQRFCESFLSPLEELHGQENNNIENFLAQFGVIYLTGLYKPDALKLYRLIHSEGLRFPQIVTMFFQSGPNLALEELRKSFIRYEKAGQMGSSDHFLAAAQFLGMLRGERHLRFSAGIAHAPLKDEIEYQVKQAVRQFVRGVPQ